MWTWVRAHRGGRQDSWALPDTSSLDPAYKPPEGTEFGPRADSLMLLHTHSAIHTAPHSYTLTLTQADMHSHPLSPQDQHR